MVLQRFSVERDGYCCLVFIVMGSSHGKYWLIGCPMGNNHRWWAVTRLCSGPPVVTQQRFSFEAGILLQHCWHIMLSFILQQWSLHSGYLVNATIACMHVLQWFSCWKGLYYYSILFKLSIILRPWVRHLQSHFFDVYFFVVRFSSVIFQILTTCISNGFLVSDSNI